MESNFNISSRNKSLLKLDILKAFGADFDQEIRDSLFFVSDKAIVYPVGHHIAIRDLFVREDMRKNDIMFIYHDNDVKKITSMNVSKDNNLILVCEKKERSACISIYNLMKLNFSSVAVHKPKRKVVSTTYSQFIYSCFSLDGNYIASIGVINNENGNTSINQGIIWDVQIFQPYKDDNYKPRCIFDLPNGVTKITLENKLICTSGNSHISFWYIYENSVKEFKSSVKGLNKNKNFLDHEWIPGKIPMIVTITDENDIFILEGFCDSHKKDQKKKKDDDDDEDSGSQMIEKFIIKQHLVNVFNDCYINPCLVKTFSKGFVVGSAQGHLFFVEKCGSGEVPYQLIRYTTREKQAKVTGISFSSSEDYMVVSFNSNEIASINAQNIFENLKNPGFDLQFNIVCDGFHQGSISAMDVALQRPIIVTTSQVDKSVRIWNYLTGHCEYCKILLMEKENNQEKEMDILSVAIHPNGYYLAISDKEMIRFFHLCYRELRFYNTDSTSNDNPKSNCHLLKFSYGGHLLAAVSGKTLYIIRSYTRETLKTFDTPHTGTIMNLVFHEMDYCVYTIGNDGLIVEYNLFDFKMEKISSRYINYTGGTFSILQENQATIIACGYQNSNRYAVAEVNMQWSSGEPVTPTTLVTQVDHKLYSLCSLKSKRLEICSLAGGTHDGFMCLYPQPIYGTSHNNNIATPWVSVKSHRSAITAIAYSRDTNLLFSAGEDGNLFIYCIYESPDGETLAFEENKSTNINQLGSILDEGLGDNVLFPLSKIFLNEDEVQNQKMEIAEFKKKEDKLKTEHSSKIREKENELNRKRELEVSERNERISELKISKDATIDHYEDKIRQMENEHRQIIIEKEKSFNERLDQMSNTIHDLTSKNYLLISEHEVELRRKDDEYEKKLKELEKELRKKFEELKANNDGLNEDLKQRQRLEEMKFMQLDLEHEQEINYKIEKYDTRIAQMEKEKFANLNEIMSLKDSKIKLDQELQEKDNQNKKLSEERERNYNMIQNLKMNIETKEREKEELKKKLKLGEELLQEKSKLSDFSSVLKKELYRKNVEIMSNFNKQQIEKGELKETSKNFEKELEESIRLLERKEKETKKYQIQIEEYKEKYEKERLIAKEKEKDLDNILQKIYDTFQSNDKNKIIAGFQAIYNKYFSSDRIEKIDSSKLNVNIRDELEKQIDFLQKGILNVTDAKTTRERIQNSEIYKKTNENSMLIEDLNKMRRINTIIEKDRLKLKSDLSALQKKLEKYMRLENEGLLRDNTDSLDLPKLKYEANKTGNVGKDLGNNNNILKERDIYTKSEIQASPGKTWHGKPWKDGILYKGNILSRMKDTQKEAYKLSEIKKAIEEKNDIIHKQRLEIQALQLELQNIYTKKDNIPHTNSSAQINKSSNFGENIKINLGDIDI